jgi:hypothetical protein
MVRSQVLAAGLDRAVGRGMWSSRMRTVPPLARQLSRDRERRAYKPP